MDKLSQYRLKRTIVRTLLLLMAAAAFLTAAAGILFFVNRFSLGIRLNGSEELELEYGTPYTEQGAEARVQGSLFFREGFPVDTQVTVEGSVDPNVVGSYTLTYSGAYRELEGRTHRTVHVVDKKKPTIELKEIPGHFTIPGEAYAEEGYTAYDEYDGDLTDRVRAVEVSGTVVYSVSDASGNEATVTREVYYYDPIAPELELVGETVILMAGEDYADPGFTAVDNCAGDISDRVEVTGDLKTYLAGSYQLSYSVTDDYENTTTAQRTVIVQPREQPATVMPEGRVIYLTFDDGPSEYTRQLLEILKRNEVHATFFLTAREHTDVIPEIAEQGHSLAVHSVTHDYASIYASPEAYFEDLQGMRQIIREMTGEQTNLVRFPGGSSNTVSKFNPGIMTTLSRAVRDCGYEYFDWNVDSDDAGKASTADEVFQNVTEGVQWAMENYGFAIVLQHDTKDFSIAAVERIIRWGKENGYTFLPLGYDSPTIHHRVSN